MTKTRIRWVNALLHRGPGYDLPTHADDLRTVFAALADRYEHLATTAGVYIGPTRAAHITRAAADIRHVLATGRMPAYLHTDNVEEAAR